MTLFAVVLALLLERHRPSQLFYQRDRAWNGWIQLLAQHLNSGERRHGTLAWMVAVVPVVGGVELLYLVLGHWGIGLGWLFHVAVLSGLVEFRGAQAGLRVFQGSDSATNAGESCAPVASPEAGLGLADRIASLIETAVLAVYGRVLALLFWDFWLPGPGGAVLYWVARELHQHWGSRSEDEFGHFSRVAFALLDWLPARVTAFTFAIVGNFEDALFCWRTQAPDGTSTARMLLASAAGALGVRLGEGSTPRRALEGLELGVGELPESDHLRSAEGMIWRTLILWLALMTMLTLAALVGD